MMRLSLLLLCVSVPLVLSWSVEEQDKQEWRAHVAASRPRANQPTGVDWWQRGQDELNQVLSSRERNYEARNVIYFIGDGMGVTTLTAGRIFNAQQNGQSVTEAALSWEQFSYAGIVKTYNTDQQVPDSAGTATAFACGVKAAEGVIGVNENVARGVCSTMAGNEVRSAVHYAQDAGKWAGIVTTTEITHATPAAAYAHAPDRNWQSDSDVPPADWAQCNDIAYQLVTASDNLPLRVVLGGGRRDLMHSGQDDEEGAASGGRSDGRDLRQAWKDHKSGLGLEEGVGYAYVENKTDFNNVDTNNVQYLMGLFEPGHMKYEADRREETGDTWTEPSLAEMVKTALDILKRGPDGYILYVEGGRIDHAHHANNAHRSLMDVVALSEAVEVAMNETSEDDTLIVLTADHSHAFTVAGYQDLDNDILGLVRIDGELELMNDNKPYTTVGYSNGPGYTVHRQEDRIEQPARDDLTNTTTTDKGFVQDAGIKKASETHAGEDVVVYARGPMAHLFRGQHEQNYIAHAAMYAACIGPNLGLCGSK